MEGKTVIVTGAGFSAPANLPIQDKILDEMIKVPNDDFLNAQVYTETTAFLHAYIDVAIFLLKEYGNFDTSKFEMDYFNLKNNYNANERVQKTIEYIENILNESLLNNEYDISKYFSRTSQRFVIDYEDYQYRLLVIKEQLRTLLAKSKISVCLEDIFTSFDKSVDMRENAYHYTYNQLDVLQQSILRLFVYYFSRRVNEHSFNAKDYLNMVDYIKDANIDTVITTNWDVLLERYFDINDIAYTYLFNSSYVLDQYGKEYNYPKKLINSMSLIKIHGSINWFRCLKCGTLHVWDTNSCGDLLLNERPMIKCPRCGSIETIDNISFKPEIITPTMLKAINSQLYNNLWKNAAYALHKAKKVIFCGYSLPLADFEFRYMLKQNIQPNTSIDVVLYKNDNPLNYPSDVYGLLPEKRYKELFCDCSCKFFYDGFGEYFNNCKNV